MAHFPSRTKLKHPLSAFKGDPTGWVELFTEPDVAEVERVYSSDEANDFTRGLILLTSLIQDWGLTEEDGATAAITIDNVRRLGMANINELLQLITMPGASEALSPKANDS